MGINNAITWTAEMDAQIRRVYERRERGGNKRLGQLFRIKPGRISDRAAVLGLPPLIVNTKRTNDCQWTSGEIEIISSHLGEPIAQIRARLYRKGYHRSLSSIRSLLQRKRAAGIFPTRAEQIEARDAFTTSVLAQGMGVGIYQVQRWIKQGLLKGKRSGAQDWIVTRRDLKRFLTTYPAHWDHRCADKWFLLDALLEGD